MPNNKKQKKRRDYSRHKFYYESMKPVKIHITNEHITDVLLDMWEK